LKVYVPANGVVKVGQSTVDEPSLNREVMLVTKLPEIMILYIYSKGNSSPELNISLLTSRLK
jgi:hypothetical protein